MHALDRIAEAPPVDRLRWRFLNVLAVWMSVAMAGASIAGDDPRPEKIVLFDGKTLEGWKKTDFSKPGEIRVEDGAIVLSAGSPMTGITCTKKDLPTTNYELTYEAKRLTGRDFFAAATFPVGKSFVTFVNGGWGGSVTGLSSLDGADASENDSSKYIKFEDRTWYRFRVRVTDRTILGWIDDKEVLNVDHADRRLSTRLETRANQPLGFATWETGGAIRRIEVRKLTAEEIASEKKKAG